MQENCVTFSTVMRFWTNICGQCTDMNFIIRMRYLGRDYHYGMPWEWEWGNRVRKVTFTAVLWHRPEIRGFLMRMWSASLNIRTNNTASAWEIESTIRQFLQTFFLCSLSVCESCARLHVWVCLVTNSQPIRASHWGHMTTSSLGAVNHI